MPLVCGKTATWFVPTVLIRPKPEGTHLSRRAKHLFGYLYKHIADLILQEMIFMPAQSDGREAFLVLNKACSRDITDLAELTALNQDFDNSNIEADVGVTSDSITLFSRHLNGISTLAALKTCARAKMI
jgi:hypothetical protein